MGRLSSQKHQMTGDIMTEKNLRERKKTVLIQPSWRSENLLTKLVSSTTKMKREKEMKLCILPLNLIRIKEGKIKNLDKIKVDFPIREEMLQEIKRSKKVMYR